MGSQDHPGASRMERARISAGFTIPEVAARLTRNPASVRRWELGQHQCSRDVLLALAKMYGTTPDGLVD
jgi:transcriptional regulator with XRE-family HTH domain